MIARHPIKQMISWTSSGYKMYVKAKNNSKCNMDPNCITKTFENWMKDYITGIEKKSPSTAGYNAILNECKTFTNSFTTINDNDDDANIDNINNINNINNIDWIMQQYKHFIGQYLYHAKSKGNNVFSFGSVDRRRTFFQVTVLFPALLMFIYNYDEMFGYKNWNNFRLIEYEWLYYDAQHMNDGLTMIKCWLQTGDDLSNKFNFNNFTIDESYYKCPKVFHYNKKYYDKLTDIFMEKKEHKFKSWAIQTDIDNQNKQFFLDFYRPCTQAMVTLINQRKEIQMGGWIPWTEWPVTSTIVV